MIESPVPHFAEQIKISEAGMLSRLVVREQAAGIVPAEQLLTLQDRMQQYARLEHMVGNTPLDSIQLSNGTTIWIKRESENPSESHYDRASLAVLKQLEMEGLIRPGDTILEGTSGSAGRSFAWACSRLGFKLDMIVPHGDEFPIERERDMKALGANLIHVPEKGGIGKVTKHFKRMMVEMKRNGYEIENYELEGKPIIIFRKGNDTVVAPNHSEIIITPQAFATIADEVVTQLPPNTKIDVYISTLGNGATLKGISEGLRAAYGNVVTIGIEHKNAPMNAIRKLRAEVGEEAMRAAFERMYGFTMPERDEMRYHNSFGASTPGYEPPFVEVDKLDGIILVGDEWEDFKRRNNTYAWLNGNTTNLIGNTSAENLYTAIYLGERPEWQGRNILVINYDKADQYADWPPQVREYTYPIGQLPEERVAYAVNTLPLHEALVT